MSFNHAHTSSSRPTPRSARVHIAETRRAAAHAAALTSDGLPLWWQDLLHNEHARAAFPLNIFLSLEDHILLEEFLIEEGLLVPIPITSINATAPSALEDDNLDVSLDQPLSSFEFEMFAVQNNSVDVDMDMVVEEIALLPHYFGFSWIEPVAEDPLIFTTPAMAMGDIKPSIKEPFCVAVLPVMPKEEINALLTSFRSRLTQNRPDSTNRSF